MQNSPLESSCVVVALIENYSTSKPLNFSPDKSHILSCDTCRKWAICSSISPNTQKNRDKPPVIQYKKEFYMIASCSVSEIHLALFLNVPDIWMRVILCFFLCCPIDLCAVPHPLSSPLLPNLWPLPFLMCSLQRHPLVLLRNFQVSSLIHAGSPNAMTFHRRSFVRLPLCKFLPHLFNTQPSSDLRVFL